MCIESDNYQSILSNFFCPFQSLSNFPNIFPFYDHKNPKDYFW